MAEQKGRKYDFIIQGDELDALLKDIDEGNEPVETKGLFQTKPGETRYILYEDIIAIKVVADSKGEMTAQATMLDDGMKYDGSFIFNSALKPGVEMEYISEKEYNRLTGEK